VNWFGEENEIRVCKGLKQRQLGNQGTLSSLNF